MADQQRLRTLAEMPEYTANFDSIVERYSEEVIGPVLTGLLNGIAANPQAYDRTVWGARIAKSDRYGLTIPTFRIFFQITNEGKDDEAVLLLWIEETNIIDEIT